MRKTVLTTLLLSSLSGAALAAETPREGIVDPRIKTYSYRENEVYRLSGYYGYSTVIEFDRGENIETVSIGDSESWQIHKPKRGNLLLIKPLEENAITNMTVVTDQRMYSFEMNAFTSASHRSPGISYRINFKYPTQDDLSLSDMGSSYNAFGRQPSSASGSVISSHGPQNVSMIPLSGQLLNFEYAYSGEEAMRPIRAFDDGKFTYFQFPDMTRTPAIFTVDPQGHESLINYSQTGPYIVVETLARQFTLRDGDLHTCIFNKSYTRPLFDDFSPRHVEASSSYVESVSGPSNLQKTSVKADYQLNN